MAFLLAVTSLSSLAAYAAPAPISPRDVHNFDAIPFSPGFDVSAVASLATSLPSHSWEYGTAAEALLELYNPELSVFGAAPFPVPSLSDANSVKSLAYAAGHINIGASGDGGGAVGDPASLGVSAVLLGNMGGDNFHFANAAEEEVNFITNVALRFSNGAISQRTDVAELWADFMYMAPPFLAYYAASTSNIDLLTETVSQCGLYRQILRDNAAGVWQHIIGPQSQDTGLWSTGNAWAAAGMSRVLATVMKAPVAQSNSGWQNGAISDLSTWIQEILDGAINSPQDGGLLRNYLDDTSSDGHGFGEISGSSLLAATAYRMAVLQPGTFGSKYIAWADGIRKTLGGGHVQDDGTVLPAVNPLGWADTTPYTAGSPEGQNFVVLLYAAWRDCVLAGKCSQ